MTTETKTQHTPGPWNYADGYDKMWAVYPVLDVYPGTLRRQNEPIIADVENEANARLIAAAPGLLAALKSLLPLAVHVSPDDVAVHAARAAITRAEGRSE